jgi:hypothetical protein
MFDLLKNLFASGPHPDASTVTEADGEHVRSDFTLTATARAFASSLAYTMFMADTVSPETLALETLALFAVRLSHASTKVPTHLPTRGIAR